MKVNSLSDYEKKAIVMEYLESDKSLSKIGLKYSIFGHCTISKWIAKFAAESPEISNALSIKKMKEKKETKQSAQKDGSAKMESERIKQLEAEIHGLKLQLEAKDILLDIVKNETGYDIRKKAGTKQ
jgi:transposase-like protein